MASSNVDALVGVFNKHRSAFETLPVAKPLDLSSLSLFSPWVTGKSVIYLNKQPISTAPITCSEGKKLRFGEILPLFTLNLAFGYIVVFPTCEVKSDPRYVVAIRRGRDKYSNTELQFVQDDLVVIGNEDATLMINRRYDLLPSFDQI